MKRLGTWGIGLALLWANTAGAVETVYYIHTDALGSPVAMTDANRHVVERTQYGPYGEVLNRPEHDGPGYTGHEEDAATGLTNMQQRYDDKVIGRMLSVDPVQPDGNTGGSFNRYAYANDNPYRFTDPDGRQDCPKDKGNGGRCSPPPEPTTGCHTSGCSASANTSVIQVASPSKSEEQKMTAQTNQSAGNSAGSSSGSASGQSSAASGQSEKVTKEWTIQDFNELDKNATNSYAPLFLLPPAVGIIAAGGPPAWDAAAPYVRPVALAGCLSLGIACHGASEELQELPHEFAAQEEKLEEMYEGEKAELINAYKQVIESDQH